MMRAGGRDDILLDHDATYIVAAKAKPNLADLQSRRHPRSLDIQDIVQINSREREHFQIFDRSGFLLHKASERSIFALKEPGDERREPASVFLDLAHDIEMIHALLDRFSNAEHHRGGGAHSERMRRAMDVDPILHRALQATDSMANIFIQDFGAPARNRIEARVAQPRNRVAQRNAADIRDVHQFRSGEAMAPDV